LANKAGIILEVRKMAKEIKKSRHELCDEMKRLQVLWKENEKWKAGVSEILSKHDKNIKDINTFQAETKTYVTEIKNQIDRLETRLFSFMDGLVKNLTAKEETENKAAQDERTNTTDKWLAFSKWIIGGTIFVIVAYFFGKELK
jgi:septal ring factor EnvC (AmiA/AmiB activator)